MAEKYVIAVMGSEKTGKTCVVNNVWDMLPCFESCQKIFLNNNLLHEVWGFVKACDNSRLIKQSKSIGVASRGDEPWEIIEWVKPLMEERHCDVVVCACHLPGEDKTFDTVKDLCTEHGYTLITSSHFSLYSELKDRAALRDKPKTDGSAMVRVGGANLSRISAKGILELIEALTKK